MSKTATYDSFQALGSDVRLEYSMFIPCFNYCCAITNIKALRLSLKPRRKYEIVQARQKFFAEHGPFFQFPSHVFIASAIVG